MLIIGISSGYYFKIAYSYNSHIVIIHIHVYTQSQITYKYMHKFTITINIDIVIYNLQHTQVHALYAYQVQLFSIHKIT
jgi:hypothetical protein